MSALNQRWTRRTAELDLPRPRTISMRGLDSGRAGKELLGLYDKASALLADPDQHMVLRFEAVGEYSKSFGRYAGVLGAHIATADAAFYQDYDSFRDDERLSRIFALLANKTTRSQGLAAALLKPTMYAGVATGLTAFAIKDNSRGSFNSAQSSLAAVEKMFVEYDAMERGVS